MNRVSNPLGASLRASTNLLAEPHAPAKHTEIIHSLTSSRLKIVDLVIPQGAGGAYTPSTPRIKPSGPRGAEAGKNQSCYEHEGSREENLSSRRPDPHKLEEVSRRAAQDQAGQKAQRPGRRGRQPQRSTPPRGEKIPLDSEPKVIRRGVAKTQNNPEQEHPGAGSSQSRSIPEREPSDRTRRPDLLQGTQGEETGQSHKCQEQGPPRTGALGSKSPN